MSTTTRNRVRRAALGLAAVALTAGGTVVTASSAQAATARNGVCETGEFCLFYNSDFAGSVSDFAAGSSISDYGPSQPDCYEFKGAGNGQGVCVKNNAASAWNRTGETVTVYYNSGYQGSSQSFAAGAKANLNATLKNQNASHRSGTASVKTPMSDALYKADGRLTCGFNGYTTQAGYHEGIDFARYRGAAVYNLVAGVVTNVAPGYDGRGGLSTIAVYNAASNKTVIYLHSAPKGVYVGQSVARGQQIATESYRGITDPANFHTHVEVRDGRQTHANPSVGDWTLSNSDPTPFWNSQGYSVQ